MARYIDADELLNKLPNDLPYKASVKRVLMQAPTADVVPKSEVEELSREYESLAKTVNEASELIRKLRSKIDELKKDRYQVFPDGKIELIPRTDIDEIKREVAREIFEEIENHKDKIHGIVLLLPEELAELKKKYTEEYKDEFKG